MRPTLSENKRAIFESYSPGKAILAQALPTIASQIISVLYAVADLFYVGQLGNPDLVAAVRFSFPPFLFLTALANLFGIGASSLIGRSLGAGKPERARAAAGFAFWTACAVAFAYAAAIWIFRERLLPFLGTTPQTYASTLVYLQYTVIAGALPLVVSNVLAHLLRAEGEAKTAGKGIALGGILNILLAPVLMFWCGMGLTGAALAVLVSSAASALFFIIFLLRKEDTVFHLSPAHALHGIKLGPELLSVGFASFAMTSLASVSNLVLNTLATAYGSEAVAGLGIAKQVDQMIFSCSIGLAQGTLPLIAYNFASGNHGRLKKIVKTAMAGGVACSAAATAVLMLFAYPVTRCFIAEPVTAEYAAHFVRIMAFACPLSIIGHLSVSGFQGCGAKWRPLFLAVLRKGSVDVPLMIIFSSWFGVYGIAAATPVSELITATIAVVLWTAFFRKLMKKTP